MTFGPLFVLFIFIIIIFLYKDREKKWVSGPKHLQILYLCGFTDFSKVGQKWAMAQKKWAKCSFRSFLGFKSGPKVYKKWAKTQKWAKKWAKTP